MEQIGLFSGDNWIDNIKSILAEIMTTEELPENALVLVKNSSKVKDITTSYSVSVNKTEYPRNPKTNNSSKTPLFNIQVKTNSNDEVEKLYYCLPEDMIPILEQKSFDITYSKRESDAFTRVSIDHKSDRFIEFSLLVIKSMLDTYFSKGGQSFGCCSMFEECSDTKKCLHENKLYARGCAYYHNLKQGRIFYGKNRNVENGI